MTTMARYRRKQESHDGVNWYTTETTVPIPKCPQMVKYCRPKYYRPNGDRLWRDAYKWHLDMNQVKKDFPEKEFEIFGWEEMEAPE